MRKLIEFDVKEIKSREIKPERYLSVLTSVKLAVDKAKGDVDKIEEISKSIDEMLSVMDDERFMNINSVLILDPLLLDTLNIHWLDRAENIAKENPEILKNLSHKKILESDVLKEYLMLQKY
jgi:hypothetical protein